MMQIIENWSWLDCKLVNISETDEWFEVTAIVEKSENAGSFPNLIEVSGQPVKIRLKPSFDRAILKTRFRIKARRTAPQIIWGDVASLQLLP